jgi:hypothetical protein
MSGLYILGDNGYGTPSSGVDARSQGSTGGRLRANGTLIERNSFNIPAIHRVDLRLQRRFAFGPKVRVDGIFEMYNVFNRSNFESFTLNESNAKYGQPLASTLLAYQPRMLQFGFRTQF